MFEEYSKLQAYKWILEAWQTPQSLLAPLQLPKAYQGTNGTKSGAQFLFQVITIKDISASTTELLVKILTRKSEREKS